MKRTLRRARFWGVTAFALAALSLGLSAAACCTGMCGGNRSPNLICTERPPPTDPLAGSALDDGFTAEQRNAYIRRAVGSTVEVSVQRYTAEDGVKSYGGTGVVISNDRTILTAYHVVRNAAFVYVSYRSLGADNLTVTTGRGIPVQVVAISEARDVALLRPLNVEPDFPAPLPVDAAWRPAEGELLWQFGKTTRWSRGTVVDTDEESTGVANCAEMAFTVRPGDSGGPVMTSDGRVVGVILSRNDHDENRTDDDRGYFMPMHLALDALHYRP